MGNCFKRDLEKDRTLSSSTFHLPLKKDCWNNNFIQKNDQDNSAPSYTLSHLNDVKQGNLIQLKTEQPEFLDHSYQIDCKANIDKELRPENNLEGGIKESVKSLCRDGVISSEDSVCEDLNSNSSSFDAFTLRKDEINMPKLKIPYSNDLNFVKGDNLEALFGQNINEDVGSAPHIGITMHKQSQETEYFTKKFRPMKIGSYMLGFNKLSRGVNLMANIRWMRNGEIEETSHIPTQTRTTGGDDKYSQWDQHSKEFYNEQQFGWNSYIQPGISKGKANLSANKCEWLRYTMYLSMLSIETARFLVYVKQIKHFLIGLEKITGCEIRISVNEFLHRGRIVRIFIIDGPNNEKVMRCKNSLPENLNKLIIQDHELETKECVTLKKTKAQFRQQHCNEYDSLRALLEQSSRLFLQEA